MSILKIARMGHPVLHHPAEPVADPTAPEVRRLVADMWETLRDIGGAGLAAPQVHVPWRVVIFHVPALRAAREGAEPVAPIALVNPEIIPLNGETVSGWEACLSVPGLTGWVPRHAAIRYRGVTPEGEAIDREATGFHARVVQHECDHLEGRLYTSRIGDMSRLIFESEIRHFQTAS
jgi:peptide deformylase